MDKFYTIKTDDNRYYDWFLDKLVDKLNINCIYVMGNAELHLMRVKDVAVIHEVNIVVGEQI